MSVRRPRSESIILVLTLPFGYDVKCHVLIRRHVLKCRRAAVFLLLLIFRKRRRALTCGRTERTALVSQQISNTVEHWLSGCLR